jgi:hypothetical protein
MDVTSLKTPTYAESSRATILDENNWTMWSLTAQQYSATLTYSSDGLTLTGSFHQARNHWPFLLSEH